MTEQTEKWSAQERKNHPIFTGVLRYFPDALLEVAELSKIGNDQHNPGQSLHWDRSKSQDQGDALVRHQIDAGTRDTDGVRHSAKVAWRALAQLQLEIEADEQQAKDDGYTVDIFKTKPVSIEPRPNYDEPPFDGQVSLYYNGYDPKALCNCDGCMKARCLGLYP